MITDSFDKISPAIITPRSFSGERGNICDTCIITFSKVISDYILDNFECEQVGVMRAANGDIPFYTFEYKNKKIGFYLSSMGSALAATLACEVSWQMGADKFIMFGSCGSLDGEKTSNKYIIPTHAYRDEGLSYHYAPAADYIEVKNSKKLEKIFAELNLPYVTGRTWTTDAMYRETRANCDKRKSEGCIAVEMEVAGVQAMCDFEGLELYDFLVAGDVLDLPEWNEGELKSANHTVANLYTALEIALRV